ncbi:hypothetical protein ACFL6C_06335 [Myxococcota bacterium]
MPRKPPREPTPFDASGKVLTIRTSTVLEEELAWYTEQLEKRDLRRIDRAEAGRRLLVYALRRIREEGLGS